MKRAFLLASVAAVLLNTFVVAQQPPVAGPNRNVVGGPVKWSGAPFASQLITGDPYGQRQDEISCMVDSRNALLIGCAFNDYTPVELPGLAADGETGDAWIGRGWSTDGGLTWKNALLPGYKQDNTPEGLASPLHGLDAGADPTWRSGPNGRSYLSGIAFNRVGGTQTNGVIFVQTYINNNNIENDPSPLKAAGPPVIIDDGNSGQFQDKSWLGVGPDGAVHVAYATFVGGNKPHSIVWYQVSRDGGKTFTRSKLSEGDKVSNGASIAIHPVTGWVDVSWRRRQTQLSPTETDAIQFVRSTDGGISFTSPTTIVSLPQMQRAGDLTLIGRAFDQSSGPDFFRNISNPTMTADDQGRVYVAWAERIDQGTADQNGREIRDSQIKLAVGTAAKANGNQVVWSTPTPIDLLTPGATTTRGQQFRPSLWFAFGKVMLSYMHTRDDDKATIYQRVDVPDPGNPGAKIATYQETTELRGDLPAHPEKVFNEFIIDRAPASTPVGDVAPNFNASLLRRHTEDVIALMGTPAAGGGNAFPTFTRTKVSRYSAAFRNNRVEQVQFNVLTRALHCGGNCAFAGDYDDVVAQAFVPNATGTGWLPNTAPSTAPGFYVAWTDNRDLRPLAPPTTFSRVGPTCQPAEANATGTRNQNPYVARVGNGLYVYSFGNQKPLNTTFGRAFTVLIQNAVNSTKTYRATISPQNTVPASWLQFSPQTTLDVSIPPFSSAARVVYAAKSTDSRAPIRVDVVELNPPGGVAALQSFTVFNPDRSVTLDPALSPDPTIDQTNPATAEIFVPDATSPDATSANVRTPDATSPDATSPDATSPDATSVAAQFPDATSPDATSPDATSPDATSYPAMTPDATSPDATSTPPIYPTVTDTINTFTNKGNVAGSFAIKTFATKPLCAGCKLQVLVMKPSLTPTQRGCDFKNQDTSALVSNIASLRDADLQQGNAFTFNPNDASTKNLTVSVPPGGKLSVIYRLFNPLNLSFTTDTFGRRHSVDPTFNPATDLVPIAIAQSVSTPDIPGGCPGAEGCPTQGKAVAPGNTVYLTTTSVPEGVQFESYSKTMEAFGGTAPYHWTATGLPSGLTLSDSGQISGTPTSAAGDYTVTFTVNDSASPTPHTASRMITVRVNPVVFVSTFNGHQILRVNPKTGDATTIFTGNSALNTPNPGPAFIPEDIVLGPDRKLYVCNSLGNPSQILRMDPDGNNVQVIYQAPSSPALNDLRGPEGPSFHGNDLYVNTRGATTATGVWKIANATAAEVGPPVQVYSDGPNRTTSLSGEGGINDTQTTFSVADATGMSAGHNLQIGSELMILQAVDVNILTVTRGTGGTSPAAHSTGATVFYGGTHFGEGTAVFDLDGNLLIVDRLAGRVLRLPTAPCGVECFPVATTLISGLAKPFGIAVNQSGDIFVVDNSDDGTIRKVKRYTSTGAFVSDYVTFSSPDGPSYLDFDPLGRLFIVTAVAGDGSGAKLWMVDPSGATKTVVGSLSFGVGVAVPFGPLP